MSRMADGARAWNGQCWRNPTCPLLDRNGVSWSRAARSGTPHRGTLLSFQQQVPNGNFRQKPTFAVLPARRH